MISVLILTRNEQQELPDCLTSVTWSDDVHVFDSFSTDETTVIARSFGAQVHQRIFDDYASQRNAALHGIAFKYPWLFLLDADERPTAALELEMQAAVANASDRLNAFRIRRRDFLSGTWLKHAQISPYYIRLVRPDRVRYVRAINEVLEVEGEIGNLAAQIDHFPFSKGITHWINRHNTYSAMEAELIYRQQGINRPSLLNALFSSDFHQRRLHQKALFYRLPGRPLLKWIYMVFWRGAVLDGRAGLTYAALQSIYEYLIVLKTEDLKKQSSALKR